MNNYTDTEKSLKRWLKSRVKVTVATVVGFLITGAIGFAANVNQEQGVYDNNEVITKVKSTKFIKGKDGNLELYTNGSTVKLLENLKGNHKNIEEIIGQLGVQDGKNLVVVGALAGEGKLNTFPGTFIHKMSNLKSEDYIIKLAKGLDRINTAGKLKDREEIVDTGETKTIIGDKNTSPLILGLVGGDLSLATGSLVGREEKLFFNKKGNSTININNGNVFGGVTGSAAI
uniref:hypothetical protein n=1 Tax=Fusobacterium sp. TaxID=68766 RepID=UPI00263193F5